MKKVSTLTAAVAFGLLSTSAFAASSDLLVTPVQNGKQTQLNLDFVNDGQATSMQFDIDLNGMSPKLINFDNCISGVSGSHQGGCNIVDGKLRVLVFSMANEPIPSGTLGNITLNLDKSGMKSAPSIDVSGMVMAAPPGVPAPQGSAYVESGVGINESVNKK